MRTKDLIDIVLGKQKPDLVIKNANLVNVCSGEIYETDIAIARGLIVGVGVGRYDSKKRDRRSE